MAKKKKNEEVLPEGMSRRQAKLAARAAERAALERDPRPYGGLAMEADLVALQEFVPSAFAEIKVAGVDRKVYVATVLPGAGAALVRDEEFGGDAFVGLQTAAHSHNPNRDLAYALNWLKTAKPGETLQAAVADGSEPALDSLLSATDTLDVQAHEDFNWWLPEGTQLNPQLAQSMQAANDSILPSFPVTGDFDGVAWWIDPGEKAHIRWVRTDDEDKLLQALARIAAAGELLLGEGTKFAGVFRTHGIAVPVWDLDPAVAVSEYGPLLEALDKRIKAELDNDAALSPDERKALQNIKSRQVTIR
ncbi:DUF5926 family protein [Corynebacterium epidermidicanis]|uniref:DUF5926 domain-containing protein n=1 Tax=Corynebacterium epidermidicanis TaxID=1050174 RepID=A0A0G3GSU2_9CORY|nr:DUF5926 family protein [Corynebacterium epidermidicanis]AKK04184.1 hypothetical protein CEPID_11780 [Corynebacterium epidermidicanis]